MVKGSGANLTDGYSRPLSDSKLEMTVLLEHFEYGILIIAIRLVFQCILHALIDFM